MSHVHDPLGAAGPDGPAGAPVPSLQLVDWAPRPQVSVPVTRVARAAVPAIDVHNHLGRWLTTDWCAPDVAALLAMMDDAGVATVVNLDGLWGDELDANLDRYDRAHPGRFLTFCQVDWTLLQPPRRGARDPGAAPRQRRPRRPRRQGVEERGPHGPWAGRRAGAARRPARDRRPRPGRRARAARLVHVADPKAFFEPLDAHNERFDELAGQPDWSFADRDRYPSFDQLLDAFERLLVATPGTRYIGAHVGCVAEDLDRVERLLRAAPNLVVDIAGRLGELGRQPRRFRRLVEAFPDRVLFGTDAFPLSAEQLEVHFRFLETDDECFDYAPGEEIPPQGRWQIAGAALPAHLLPGLYAGNARRVLGLDEG